MKTYNKRAYVLLTALLLCLAAVFPAAADTFVFPASLTTVGNEAFAGDTALTAVSLGNTVTGIGDGAFKGCTGLTEVTLSTGVQSIGDEAFGNCTALTKAVIAGKTTVIGTDAFDPGIVLVCWDDSLAAVWADANGILRMPPDSGIKAGPADVTAAAGDTVSFTVTAVGAASYQWQVKRGELDWTDTFLEGYDTDTLSMEAVFSRAVLQWRCAVTLLDGTQLYSGGAGMEFTTKSRNEVEVTSTSKVQYDVPLYDQGSAGICWSVSMQMVNDWMMGLEHTTDEAYDLSYERAYAVRGEKWDWGYWPYDYSPYADGNLYTLAEQERFKVTKQGISQPDIGNLYQLLVMYGPSYLTYGAYSPDNTSKDYRGSGHIVVLTGVDLETGTLYTNNPWLLTGEQSWDEFIACYEGGEDNITDGTWELERVQGTDWVEWGPENIPIYP